MIRYTAHLKGTGVYSDNMSVSQICEHDQCTHKAEYTIMGDHWDSDPTYVCETHLERKEFILQGRCDGCAKHSFEPWLCQVKLASRNLYKLCKKCHRVKRRENKC